MNASYLRSFPKPSGVEAARVFESQEFLRASCRASVGVSWRWTNPPWSHNPNRSSMKGECNYPSLISDGMHATANKRLSVCRSKRAPSFSPGGEGAADSRRFVSLLHTFTAAALSCRPQYNQSS